MAIFRQYIAPLLVVLIFFVALMATSARIFLPSDMSAPAPINEGVGFNGDGFDQLNDKLLSLSVPSFQL
ncbi:MAG: hypothetical protein IGS39_19470 [Calothrix sp. C42_A2020_038]|nr:hypothetical protein [Calothrix sp. C42_A2020_038]